MILYADARHLPLIDGCVDCVVTSPPYWGLRDYGTGSWDGGDPECLHAGMPKPRNDTTGADKRFGESRGLQPSKRAYVVPVREVCPCGAVRVDSQIGLETTPDHYVAEMVSVFREVRRVLKASGTVWLNLGDCYATFAGGVGECPGGGKQGASWKLRGKMTPPNRMPIDGLKPKDLVGIPWRVAFALQADGWYLRSDIIWHKPNPMPESVTDRPTKAHEYLFLLVKSEQYYYDHTAIKEPSTGQDAGNGFARPHRLSVDGRDNPEPWKASADGKRNRRSVWTIPTKPYNGAHFATMPEKLVEPCILAGCPLGGRVLDPFLGSGTVAAVAERLGRRWVGTDLQPAYHGLARSRTAQRGLSWV